jgi:hypothetical protein
MAKEVSTTIQLDLTISTHQNSAKSVKKYILKATTKNPLC